jgi:ferric-dicitrate binding protein FerR (iron transport regulator)
VLGTTFEVRHYRGDSELRVAVASGKVLVSSEARHPQVLVTMGQVLSVTDSTQNVKSVDNVDTEIGWLGDQLVFKGVPMAKVLETLTRWYGYKFQYTDSAIARQIVTIGLSMQSSNEALATLEQILDVNLTVVGDTVKLTPVRSRAAPNQRAKHYDVWLPTSEVGR